jgi:1,4-dihydroxy-2-naphthoate octaprenyltransferase
MNERRVLPAEDPLVQSALKDFRVAEGGRKWVVRMKGEGRFRSSVFPEFNETGRRVMLELIPASQWERPGMLWRWLVALRFPYLLFSLLPLILVSACRWRAAADMPWALTALLFLSVSFVHMSCNLWSEYEDHMRGVDAPEHAGGTGVVQRLWIPAVHLRNSGMVLFSLGAVTGAVLLALLPMSQIGGHLVWLAFAGGVGAASYSGWPFHYKYIGLGEPIVFFLSGPVVTVGAALVLFGGSDQFLFFALASLPLAFLAVLRLHGGNMQRIPFDTMAGVFTIARWLGFFWSKAALGFLLFAPFAAVIALCSAHVAPLASLASLLSLPVAFLALIPLRQAKGPLHPACRELRSFGARLHLGFGLLYTLSFLWRG